LKKRRPDGTRRVKRRESALPVGRHGREQVQIASVRFAVQVSAPVGMHLFVVSLLSWATQLPPNVVHNALQLLFAVTAKKRHCVGFSMQSW
jgi:hypothetical protein